MNFKCNLTHEKCGADEAGYWDCGDSCPIGKYESSTRPGEGNITLHIDDTCRYYGIARAKKLQEIFREDF